MEKSTFGGLFDCKIVVLGLVGLQGKIILVLGPLLLPKMIENPLFDFHSASLNIYISGFPHIFGNNSASKNVSLCPEALQGPILLFYSQISPQKCFFPFFWVKKVPAKFFSLKNMWKIATFSLLAKIFSGNISRGSLTKQKRFSVLPKKIHGCGQALISCMNYKLAKKFFVFYENFQIWRSRWVQVEKFKFFWKNQKTMFLVKKIFFLRSDIQGVSGGPPGEGITILHPPIGREMIKTLTLVNLGSKSRFYYISHFRPIFRSENPVDVSTLIF